MIGTKYPTPTDEERPKPRSKWVRINPRVRVEYVAAAGLVGMAAFIGVQFVVGITNIVAGRYHDGTGRIFFTVFGWTVVGLFLLSIVRYGNGVYVSDRGIRVISGLSFVPKHVSWVELFDVEIRSVRFWFRMYGLKQYDIICIIRQDGGIIKTSVGQPRRLLFGGERLDEAYQQLRDRLMAARQQYIDPPTSTASDQL